MFLTKKLLPKGLFLIIFSLSYSISTYAITFSWTSMCDIFWGGFTADFTKDQTISGLKLQDSPINVSHYMPVWCYTIPNVTSGDESTVNITAQTQTTTGNTLELKDPVSGDVIPFNICLGGKGANLLCLNQTGVEHTYSWGGGSVSGNAPLTPVMFSPVSGNLPSDPCHSESQGCGFILNPLRGPYSNVALMNITLSDLSNIPITPGVYTDTVQILFGGQVASGYKLFPDLTLTENNNPTITLSATISPDCEIIAAPDVNFSGYITSQMATTQNIQVRCTNSTPYSITFKGSNDSSSNSWHQMISTTNPQDIIQYQMYADQQYTKPWNGDKTLEQTGNGKVQTIPIYYKTNSTQANQPAGTYQDTETLMISY